MWYDIIPGKCEKSQLTLERISNIKTQCGYYQSQTSWTQVFYWSYWQEYGWEVTYRNRSDSKAVCIAKDHSSMSDWS